MEVDRRLSREDGLNMRFLGIPCPFSGETMTKLTAQDRNSFAKTQYAFEKQRKEPIENAAHVRNAVARFDQVEGVTDEERDATWKRIRGAARKFHVELHETSWRELGRKKS
jgi:hypothetical protein